jgi:hypothetical protein
MPGAKRATLSEAGIDAMFTKPAATATAASDDLTEKETLYLSAEARDCLEDLHRELRRGADGRPAIARSVASKSRILDALLRLYSTNVDEIARQITNSPGL